MTEKKLSKKEKVLICATVVGAGVAGYFGIKYFKSNSKKQSVSEELNFIKFLVVESDCVPKALQNAENKLARQETKINSLAKAHEKMPNDIQIIEAIKKHEKEADILTKQLAKTKDLQKLIDSSDEIIYAK